MNFLGSLKYRSIIIILSLFFHTSSQAFERNIAITYIDKWGGERSLANRIKIVCDKFNWKVELWERQLQKELHVTPYDFVIHLVPGIDPHPLAKNYLALFDPHHHYFKPDGSLKEEYCCYDGYLLTYKPGPGDKNFSSRKSPPTLHWYPTVHNTQYKEVDPSYLFYMCAAWGARAGHIRYMQLMDKLNSKKYSRFYGGERFRQLFPSSYVGKIPFEGDYLLKEIQECGVYLLLHSETHLKYGIPSGRIFEAAAASACIISDKNQFVQQHFGDSVLYIDVNCSGSKIFQQVDNHMNWITSHKKQAKLMAKRAHKIFQDNYLLEDQISRLANFHDRIVNETND